MERIGSLGELKAIELGIMKEIDSFCGRNGLRYYLTFGTLLGCIRHRGFIPWDDDIDIAMPRADYDRFLSTFSSGFCRVKQLGDPHYSYPFAKIYDARTRLVENTLTQDDIGVYIDLFPLDGLPEDKATQLRLCKKVRFWKQMLRHKFSPWKRRRGWAKQLLLSLAKLLLAPFSYHSICRRIDRMCRQYDYDSSPCFSCLAWGYDFRFGEKAWMDPAGTGDFEGVRFRIPRDSDSVLRLFYGDYMQLPPEESRCSNHDFEAFWIAPHEGHAGKAPNGL